MIRAAVLLAAVVAALWLLRPWTVRPIGEPAAPVAAAAVDLEAFADDLWRTALIPALAASAVDARVLLDAFAASADGAQRQFGRADGSGSWYVAVRGAGRVISVDRSSARGEAAVDVPPFDGRRDVTLQIGPVLAGTGLRDATPLAPFSRFTNQLEFADVANALNRRVEAEVLASRRSALGPGRTVSFLGVAGRDLAAAGPLSAIVPVELAIAEAGRD